jgi:hypothetical protein
VAFVTPALPVEDLLTGQLLESNALATITDKCILVRDAVRRSYTILAVSQLASVKRIRTTHPVLLVISSGLFMIAAAALRSKDGGGAALPVALLGGAFVAGYFLSKRHSILFVSDDVSIETHAGSTSQVTALLAAVQSARARLRE